MPATDSDPTSMEEPRALEESEGSSTNTPPKAVPSSTPHDPTTAGPNHFPRETPMATKAVSVASNDCASARSSPAEASPAKPAAAPPTASEGAADTSPATSHMASASDSLEATGSSPGSASEPPSALPSTTYGKPGAGKKYPSVLTFKGVTVTLENNSVWEQFYSCGTEMILTKQGRRMFPYCRYRLSGLDPNRQYSLVLSIVPSNKYKYRWSSTKWEITGQAEQQGQCLSRAFAHHYSPGLGTEWMNTLVSFYKLKLTNQPQDLDGYAVLHSLHRYIPRLHVIPVPDGNAPSPAQPVVMGPESMTFTFPQTEFMAVTTYQNFRITQLKINHNPFAKGFRDDGNNPRLSRLAQAAEAKSVAVTEPQSPGFTPAEPNIHLFFRTQESINNKEKEKVVDLSTKTSAFSNEQVTRLVLKPIMSPSTGDDPYVPCLRGKHSLGELVLVQKRPLVDPTEKPTEEPMEEPFTAITNAPATSTPIQGSSPGNHRRRKKINRRWTNSRGREWKAAAASPTVFHSPSLTVAMQPELDDVEGLLFVSFTSKEALEVHVGDKPANGTPVASPISPMTPMEWKERVDVIPETDEETIGRLEAILLQDLRLLKHRQVIHPVLQEVGMKLSLLDPMMSIDLQYLGVQLPLSAPNLPEISEAVAPCPGDKGASFISRTGKTSDMTQIKGWRDKFTRNKETSPSNCEGSQKNLSAFCSNMLDEYLESEAQYISERAAAFSTNSEDSVAYQLPVKSSSYVKTLDSVLQHRKAASKFPVGANRPCPLSHKPLLYSALAAPTPPLSRSETTIQAEVQSAQPPPPSTPVAQRLSTYLPDLGQRPAMTPRASGLTKNQCILLRMELGAMTRGLSRTQLTEERLTVALAGLLTKQMLPREVFNVTKYPKYKVTLPECGEEFCILGCVCLSLRRTSSAPFHCRRPECMFGCACFKRRITKQLSLGGREELIQPVYSMSNLENMSKPHAGSRAKRLWNRHTEEEDPEPLFAPKKAPLYFLPLKNLKRSSGAHLTQPIREEDKGPVYKYLESMMTCARVRGFKTSPPLKLTMDPKVLDAFAKSPKAQQQKTGAADQPKKPHSPLMVKKTAKKASVASGEKEAKKQIEIQSACQWMKDRQMVLEALCQRMNHNRLSRRFWVGPYRVRPVAKIFMRKPSGSIVTYRLHISKPSKASDIDGDESDDSDEENPPVKSLNVDLEAEEDKFQFREPDVQIAVTPFMIGVIPAGRLKVRTKPVGCQASGLIQVNGKSYNQARLMLGNMGSLHPANRLAAFVTGRLRPPGGISLKVSRKTHPSKKTATPDSLHTKPAGAVVPAGTTARGAADLKPPAHRFPTDFWTKGSTNSLQNPSAFNPFASCHRSAANPFQTRSTSSPVCLTVSPALKTPSFLGQSGTYSFRICPPANQRTRSRNLPGITLPGGFTLIELPQHRDDGAAPEAVSAACADEARPQKETSLTFGHPAAGSAANWGGAQTCGAAKDQSGRTSLEPESPAELACDVKMPSDENNESREEESNPDFTSEDFSSDSDSSDYCAGGFEDDSDVEVDIETVDEWAINKVKDALKALKESGESSAGLASLTKLNAKECKDNRRRTNHTVLERQRRSEQRTLFDKLQSVLPSDPRAPRLRLLTLAVEEIQKLVETSRRLEERKRRLTQMQAVYVKELSRLSGKSDMLIKNKLKEICEKQKKREKKAGEKPEETEGEKPEETEKEKPEWKPFFSNLLSSRAALLQSAASQSKLPPEPPSLASLKTASLNAVQNKLMSLLQSNLNRPLTQPGAAAARLEAPAPSLPGGPPQKTSEERLEKQVGCTAAQTHAAAPSSQASASGTPPIEATTTFSLPLIRSKTGRIILPSSLKPLGHGFYTLMVMEPRKKGQEGTVNMSPSDVEALVRQAQSLSSGSPRALEQGGAVQASPLPSGIAALVAELTPPDRLVSRPSVARRGAKKSRKVCAAGGSGKKIPATANPDRAAGRSRGRPRKRPPAKPPGGDAGRSETSPPVEGGRNQRKSSKGTKTPAPGPAGGGDDGDGSGPPKVKRPRGRPPKKRSPQLWSPPVSRSASLPSDCGRGSPSLGSSGSKRRAAGDGGACRPLTRGSLGKDFPSAKKRSWIDVEKELEAEAEPEIKSDFESESE
ncbi:MAX gene-associated protein isoform X2 [Gasterosteus aculeatus]